MTGAEIKAAREARGWSPERLCAATNGFVSLSMLKDIEGGLVDVWNAVHHLMKALGVYVDEDEDTADFRSMERSVTDNIISERTGLCEKIAAKDGTGDKLSAVSDISARDTKQEPSPWDNLVVYPQGPTAVYRSSGGAVVIWQSPLAGAEAEIYFTTDDAVRDLIRALQREIGDAI